jgi:tetratricopeptide (TPR) repeat protein
MLFASFAHRLLLVFGAFIIALVLMFAAKFGWLGDGPKSWVLWAWSAAQAFYAGNQDDLNLAAKVVGAVGSVLGAAWTVHTGWHYAERNLPDRLNEFNARWKQGATTGRLNTIPTLSETFSIAPRPLDAPGYLRRLLLWVFDPAQRELARFRSELTERENEFRVLTSSRVRCRAEVVTAHLLVGSRLSASDQGSDALKHFDKALKFNSTDLDALELMAKQQFALGFESRASSYLDRLIAAASASGDTLRQARALRFQSEIFHGSSSGPDWDRARANLVSVVRMLADDSSSDPQKREIELALAHELRAGVQITREKFTAAASDIEAAKTLFERVQGAYCSEGLERLKALKARLDEARKDKESPGGSE